MKKIWLNRGWEFWLDTSCAQELPEDAAFTPVSVPHDWLIWRENLYEDGTGWYRRRLSIERRPEERVALFFEGVYMDAAVFVNGRPAGEWKYGYTSFHFDVTELLCEGGNEILVRCTLRHPHSRWYAGAGLYREVELWRYPPRHLVPWGLYVSPKEDGHNWRVFLQAEVSEKQAAGCEVEFRLLDDQGRPLGSLTAKAEGGLARGECVVADPPLWDIEDPHVCRVEARLLEEGQETDRLETGFGFRTVELTPERGMLLNHRPVKLHGAALHHDLGCLGTAFSRCAARRQLTLLKQMGVNAIRTGHTPPAIGVMELADELGLLVMDESFDCWTSHKTEYDYARFFPDWWQRDTDSWVRRDRNHPSLFLWCIGNEIYDTHAGPQGTQTMGRLFSGKLLAVVSGGGGDGPVVVEATAPGLAPARLELNTVPCAGEPVTHPPLLPPAGADEPVWVRKVELSAGTRRLTPEEPATELTARLLPESAAGCPLEWQLTDDGGVPVSIAKLEVLDACQVRVTGLGDGKFRARCCCANGRDFPQIISQLEFTVSGMGRIYPDPYGFLSGSLYTQSEGDIGNGNERGVSMSRTGRSWVAYENLDFGRAGSDTVTIPIFELAGEPTPIRFWRGVPYAPGSRMIGERVYHRPKQWNVYQEETFHLDQRLRGLDTFGIELNSKIHIKGFTFRPGTRAWDAMEASGCDMLYGDSYRREEEGILDIGNNVSLVFRELDFGETGCRRVTIRGRTALENNSIHICFQGGDGEERRIVEFARQEDWGEQSFELEPVYGMRDVTFLFLPGSKFDFSRFRFE